MLFHFWKNAYYTRKNQTSVEKITPEESAKNVCLRVFFPPISGRANSYHDHPSAI